MISSPIRLSVNGGKQTDESLLCAKLRERRKAKGQVRSSDELESEDEIGPGCVVLHKTYNRKIILHPDNTVVKSGKHLAVGEAEALKAAAKAGVPAPHVRDVYTTPDGQGHIRMDYIQGQSLDALWLHMSAEEKKDVTQQLRLVVEKMRSVDPPSHLIGACDGAEIRDTRQSSTYHSPPCRDEKAFNKFLLSALYGHIPPLVREAFSRRLRTNHRIVFSHCDLTPRSIMIQDGKITGLRTADEDWVQYAEYIFPELYHDKLVNFIAMSLWQNS
ncbi:hypothetical protein EDB81DRAFT_910482 [Dactylonectria macrodidyma]|uniref:Aminoglycoside phosphotransferase domain-containing protein n=1 Tax=Dactylonectria macrodidyma TaxID=307937 RepID=A0A9P9IKQ1_9HYPO|nr:hypothetical protein EDB81DRAFT_910482 [Dactylonectria macrodidyma]